MDMHLMRSVILDYSVCETSDIFKIKSCVGIEMPPKLLYSKDQKKTIQPRCHVICLPLCHHDDPLHMHCWHKYATLINISEQSSSWGSRRTQVFSGHLDLQTLSVWAAIQSREIPSPFKKSDILILVCSEYTFPKFV